MLQRLCLNSGDQLYPSPTTCEQLPPLLQTLSICKSHVFTRAAAPSPEATPYAPSVVSPTKRFNTLSKTALQANTQGRQAGSERKAMHHLVNMHSSLVLL
jgi:hypothetical protein